MTNYYHRTFDSLLKMKRKLLYRSSTVLMPEDEAPKRWLSWKRGEDTKSLTITLSLPTKQKPPLEIVSETLLPSLSGQGKARRVRSWSWQWKTDVKTVENVVDVWMNREPSKFRMNNGQTWKEFQAQRRAERQIDAHDVIQ